MKNIKKFYKLYKICILIFISFKKKNLNYYISHFLKLIRIRNKKIKI